MGFNPNSGGADPLRGPHPSEGSCRLWWGDPGPPGGWVLLGVMSEALRLESGGSPDGAGHLPTAPSSTGSAAERDERERVKKGIHHEWMTNDIRLTTNIICMRVITAIIKHSNKHFYWNLFRGSTITSVTLVSRMFFDNEQTSLVLGNHLENFNVSFSTSRPPRLSGCESFAGTSQP